MEKALQRHEGLLAEGGALAVRTGQFTGRSPKDKYVVREASTEATVDWGSVNQPMSEQIFDQIYDRLISSWEGGELFVQDCYAGADPAYTLPVRVITQRAWHALFARQLFLRPDPAQDRGSRAGIHGLVRSHFIHQPRKRRHWFEDLHRTQLQEASHHHRRYRVCRRNEEVDLYGSQSPSACAERYAHALLGEHRTRWPGRPVFRPVGHRQDYTVRRSGATADRR